MWTNSNDEEVDGNGGRNKDQGPGILGKPYGMWCRGLSSMYLQD